MNNDDRQDTDIKIARYKIVRTFSVSGRRKIIRRGLTIGDVRAWCSHLDTRRAGVWFDGFEVQA